MRRLITMLAGALVLLAIGFSSSVAKADNAPDEVYVYGEVNGIVNWNDETLSEMAKMDPLGNNAWELKLTNTNPTKFKLCGIFNGSNVYYATDSNTADKELTGTVSDLSSWRRTDGIDKGRFWYGNLNGKYLYVTWDISAGPNGFKISIKDQSSKGNTPSVDGPETIYLFGDYGSGNLWSKQTDGAKLKKTSVKDGKAVYTGTVDFKKAEKEDACFFRFYDGSKESGPFDTNSDKTVSLDTPFSTTSNTTKAFKFTPTNKGTHTVTLIYNGVQDYSVTITEGTPVVTHDYTVYFMKPSSWSKAYVTFHYDTANAASAVNGNIAMAAAADNYEMTQVEGNKYMYKLTGATRQPAKVSFSDGTDANKTEEFAFEDNKTYEGPQEVTYPAKLYLYKRNGNENSWSVLATLTPDASHNYTATKTVGNDGFSVADCHLILCESNLGDNKAWDDITTALKWTPGQDINLTNAGNTEIKKNQSSGAIKWAFNDNTADVVTFAAKLTSTETGTFDISYTKKGVIDPGTDDFIYLFGELGYGNTSWSDNYETQCRLPLASTEGNAKIYKGTVNFKAGVNKFLLWGDNQKQYPQKDNGDYEISVGTTYYTWASKNSVFVFTAPEAGSYDVEIKRYQENDYGITLIGKHYEDIYDGTLYLMSKNSLTTPYATLEYDGNGHYTASLWAEDCGDSLNEFFVVDNVKESATSVADYAGSIFTTTDNDNTAIESEGGDASISKNDNGFITWTRPSDAVTVNFTVDMRNSKFRIEVVKESSKYYLSGDINNWAIDTTDEGKAILADYQFHAVKKAEAEAKFEGEAGWYVLPVSRMHGQWQIHDGKWATGDVQENEKWGNKWECTIDGHEFKNGANMNIAASDDEGLKTAKAEAVRKYIKESFTPDSIPAEANLAHMGKGSNVTFYNMHLQHNYYNDASIYFNPVRNMAFIEGTPEDLYIYYYNAELQSGHDGTQDIRIEAKDENKNEENYYYDPSFLTDQMAWVELTPEEQAANAVVRKVEPQADGRVMTYRTRIPAGLEEPYLTQVKKDGTTVSVEHRFVFYIKNTSKINNNMRHAIVGHSFYFIYNNNLPTVVLNYLLPNETGNKYTEATSTSPDIHSIKYRLLAFNYLGELEYVQKYVDTESERPRTKKRSEARVWEYNDIVNTADYSDFKELVASFGDTHLWNVSTTPESNNTTPTTYATNNATAWHKHYNLDRLLPGDVNRFVEIEVVRKDPEPDPDTEPKLIHEFYSDFVTGNDGLIGADETTANMADDIDTKAQITNKLKPGADRNPKYKLSGTHLYIQVKAAIPTGVDNIISDDDNDAAPVYYNLQGVRVTNPDKGIYIMVKGNTSKKVRF